MDASFWRDKRPPGVPETVGMTDHSTLVATINTLLKKYADRPAFTGIGHTLTYSDVDRLSAQFACWLRVHTDLVTGDRIAIQMPNLLQYPVVVYGALRAGLIIVNTNPLYTAREMIQQFGDAGVRALVFADVLGHRVEEVAVHIDIEHLVVTSIADLLPFPRRHLVNGVVKYIKRAVKPFSLPRATPLRKALEKGGECPGDWQELEHLPDDTAMLQYTGGTTGVAKGAMLSHSNLIANMLQARAVLLQDDAAGEAVFREREEVVVAPLPLYHIYAFTVHLLCITFLGGHNILIANPRDTRSFIKWIRPWRFSGFVGLNTLFSNLLEQPDFRRCDFSRLKLTLSGGTALKRDIAERWSVLTGCTISEAYGLTECSPAVCINPLGPTSRPGMAGLPLPSTELKVTDEQGESLPPGRAGELCVRGPQVMKGYWKRSGDSSEVFDSEGWLRTGDVAVIHDDGFVEIVDRIKDMILVSGFNVYPNEIEEVVSEFDRIDHCAAIGVRDELAGERVKLFVVSSDSSLSEEDVRAYCRANMTAYKVPREIEFCDELPMTPVGKILRRALR